MEKFGSHDASPSTELEETANIAESAGNIGNTSPPFLPFPPPSSISNISSFFHLNILLSSSFFSVVRSALLELKGHSGPVIAASWTSSNSLATGSWDHSVRVWSADNGRIVANLSSCMSSSSSFPSLSPLSSFSYPSLSFSFPSLFILFFDFFDFFLIFFDLFWVTNLFLFLANSTRQGIQDYQRQHSSYVTNRHLLSHGGDLPNLGLSLRGQARSGSRASGVCGVCDRVVTCGDVWWWGVWWRIETCDDVWCVYLVFLLQSCSHSHIFKWWEFDSYRRWRSISEGMQKNNR